MERRRTTRRRGGLVPLLAAASLLAACASGGGGPARGNPYSGDLAEQKQVRIDIQNFNFADATVWALARGGERTRLGIVTGKSNASFTIPWDFSEPMQLEFDLLADVRCLTESLTVDPGDILELQISVDPASDPQCRRG